MTDNTEPNLNKILRGVADGSYTPHWQDERLVLTVPEARHKIEALIADQVREAMIQELEILKVASDGPNETDSKQALLFVQDCIEERLKLIRSNT